MKPTEKQLFSIAICEQNGFPKFEGRTKKDASTYLGKYMSKSKIKTMTEKEMIRTGAYDDDEDYPDLMD